MGEDDKKFEDDLVWVVDPTIYCIEDKYKSLYKVNPVLVSSMPISPYHLSYNLILSFLFPRLGLKRCFNSDCKNSKLKRKWSILYYRQTGQMKWVNLTLSLPYYLHLYITLIFHNKFTFSNNKDNEVPGPPKGYTFPVCRISSDIVDSCSTVLTLIEGQRYDLVYDIKKFICVVGVLSPNKW